MFINTCSNLNQGTKFSLVNQGTKLNTRTNMNQGTKLNTRTNMNQGPKLSFNESGDQKSGLKEIPGMWSILSSLHSASGRGKRQ